MTKFIRQLVLVCTPFVPLLPVSAAFNSNLVPAESRWVVFVDFNRLRESALGKEALELAATHQPQVAGGTLRLDVPKLLATLGTATAFGSNFSKDPHALDGTLVLQGTADLRKIAEGYLAQATVTTPAQIAELKDPELPFDAYVIGGQVIVAFPSEPIILISKSKAQLLKARALVRGSAPSLARAPASALTSLLPSSEGAYVIAASVMPSEKMFPDDGPHARILQMAESGSVAIGENGPRTFAHVRLLASSDEMADKLMKIVQGITAMISLTETSDKALEEFLRSVTVARENKTVALNLTYASERLAEMLRRTQGAPKNARPVPPSPASSARPGKVVAEWKANEQGEEASVGSPVYRTIENIPLVNGSTITVIGRREAGGHGRLDSVEITPMQESGPALRFEAEYMRLSRYRIEPSAGASGGKLVTLSAPSGTAQFIFPGENGTYRVRVRYLLESDEKTTFLVNVKTPEPVSAPAPEQN